MTTDYFYQVLFDQWPLTLGVLAFTALMHFLPRRPGKPEPGGVRQFLGPALDRFAEVPVERFDADLVSAFLSVQSGRPFVVTLLCNVFTTAMVLLGIKFSGAFGPSHALLVPIMLAVIVVGLCLHFFTERMKRRAILCRLEALHPDRRD